MTLICTTHILVRTAGSGSLIGSGKTILREKNKNSLLFPTQRSRPKDISDVSFQVLRQIDDSEVNLLGEHTRQLVYLYLEVEKHLQM